MAPTLRFSEGELAMYIGPPSMYPKGPPRIFPRGAIVRVVCVGPFKSGQFVMWAGGMIRTVCDCHYLVDTGEEGFVGLVLDSQLKKIDGSEPSPGTETDVEQPEEAGA